MAQSAFPTSYVAGGAAVAAPGLDASGSETAGCPACPHAVDDHDPISLRFCRATAAATTAGTAPRGCICRS